MSSIWDKYNHI